MRLLKTSNLEFEEFASDDNLPPYAILSHTWGHDEVSFADHVNRNAHQDAARRQPPKAGYDKIDGCCKLAESEGFYYVWIDTCCIDKSSSAELSEAINSMFQWYRNAAICYAYLSDVDILEPPSGEMEAFSSSRWFTRGWTLQELLAPAELVFLTSNWAEIGTKTSLATAVSRITRINTKVLREGNWAGYSVGQKMSWAAGRQTTRLEDEAYCLMGLFDVNMPLLYGEGRKAFLRLQQEIFRVSEDQSIFSWSFHHHDKEMPLRMSGLMAPSPDFFRDASRVHLLDADENNENIFEVVNQLVRMSVPVIDNVRGLKLQPEKSQPPTHQIVDMLSGDVDLTAMAGPRHPNIDLPLDTRDQPVILPAKALLVQSEVAIQVEDYDTMILTHHLVSEDKDKTRPIEFPSDTAAPAGPIALAIWCHYIYEPVMIVPLRCQIDGNQLGILLSRGSIENRGSRAKALLRLHRPSLVTLNHISAPLLWTPVTKYAAISNHTSNSGSSNRPVQSLRWPEIRVSGLSSSDYIIDTDYMMGWSFDESRSVFTPGPSAHWQGKALNPFILAAHKTRRDAAHPVFAFNIIEYDDDQLICHVEVYSDDMRRILEYDRYSFDLGQMRRAQVSLGNGSGVIAVYREATSGAFVSLSIGPLAKNRFLVETVGSRSTVGAWLERR